MTITSLFKRGTASKVVADDDWDDEEQPVADDEEQAAEAEERAGFFGASPRTPRLDLIRNFRLTQATLQPTASTSVQMAGVALAEVAPPTSAHGIILGLDVKTGWPVIHDPFVAYQEEPGFSSPNMTTFGDLGAGKSQFNKSWCCRNLMLGRRVVVVDKKLQKRNDGGPDEGEYSMMARALGYVPVTLKTGANGRRINILDPRIAGDTSAGAAGQQMLLELVVRAAMERPLTEEERKAVRVARKTAVERAQNEGRIAHVGDVVTALLSPDADVARETAGIGNVDLLLEYGRACGFALERLVSDELAGLIDGPTDATLDLDGQLICFDISSLPDEGPAVPIMMVVLNTWVRSLLARQSEPVPTLLVIDEAWHIVSGEFAEAQRRNVKVARGLALEVCSIFQHPSDIPAESPAIAMIKESQTVMVFRQDKMDDALSICDLLGWEHEEAEVLTRLPQGVAMVKIGSAPPVMCSMIMSSFELEVGDTNQAMVSTATVAARSSGEHDGRDVDG